MTEIKKKTGREKKRISKRRTKKNISTFPTTCPEDDSEEDIFPNFLENSPINKGDIPLPCD